LHALLSGAVALTIAGSVHGTPHVARVTTHAAADGVAAEGAKSQ